MAVLWCLVVCDDETPAHLSHAAPRDAPDAPYPRQKIVGSQGPMCRKGAECMMTDRASHTRAQGTWAHLIRRELRREMSACSGLIVVN
jgi:hypothetical protein